MLPQSKFSSAHAPTIGPIRNRIYFHSEEGPHGAQIRRHTSPGAIGESRRAARQDPPISFQGKQSQPKPPFPPQHQAKPGLEKKMQPRPKYEAPRYRGSEKLKDKIALITGGDSGIGRSVAVLYAREGADVAIIYLPEEQSDAEETSKLVAEEGRRALLIPGDVRRSEFCERAVEQTINELGGLDVLVNNAAYQEHQKDIADITDEQLERTFTTNIFGYFYMARAAIPHMKPGSDRKS